MDAAKEIHKQMLPKWTALLIELPSYPTRTAKEQNKRRPYTQLQKPDTSQEHRSNISS
jgi:hypothetical protein